METGLDQVRAGPPMAVSVSEPIAPAFSAWPEIQPSSDDQAEAKSPMYIPALPSLNPAQLLKGHSQYLPFPLASPRKLNFYVARNGIYHLMRSLGSNGGGIVLVPDYHHGNEIAAMKA